MKKAISLLCAVLMGMMLPMHGANGPSTYFDYQNYNHGYCPKCACSPCKCSGPVPSPCGGPAPCAAPCGAPPPCAPAAPCAPTPCQAPCAPANGTNCGISLVALGVGIAALVTAAVIIVSSGNGQTNGNGR